MRRMWMGSELWVEGDVYRWEVSCGWKGIGRERVVELGGWLDVRMGRSDEWGCGVWVRVWEKVGVWGGG